MYSERLNHVLYFKKKNNEDWIWANPNLQIIYLIFKID